MRGDINKDGISTIFGVFFGINVIISGELDSKELPLAIII
jgi:hypothetical protein